MKQGYDWHIPQDRDVIVNVSEASKKSFGEEAKDALTIHNLTSGDKTQKALLLVSALRVNAPDKQGNDARCVQFAQRLKKLGIAFTWLYFGDKAMKDAPEEMVYCGMKTDIKPYIAMADYLVQLSGSEAFCYSIVEALEVKTAVITTPLKVLPEIGFEDQNNGYVFDFDSENWSDTDFLRIVQIPQFKYKHDNEQIVSQWRELLGNTKPKHDYKPKKEVTVEVMMQYKDLQRDEMMLPGVRCQMKYARAIDLQSFGYVRIL
jgi:hypothetical protein